MANLRGKAMGHAHLVDALVVDRRDGAGKENEALVLQACQIDFRLSCQCMALGQAGDEGLLHQQLAGNAFGQQNAVNQAQIKPALLQALYLLGAVEFEHVHAHLRVLRLKGRERLRQTTVQGRSDKPEPQVTAHAVAHIARLLYRLLGERQQLPRAGQQVFARRRQAYAFAGALKQLGSNFLFQLFDGYREWRLRYGQALGSAAEMQLFGQGGEVVQKAQFHAVSLGFAFSIHGSIHGRGSWFILNMY